MASTPPRLPPRRPPDLAPVAAAQAPPLPARARPKDTQQRQSSVSLSLIPATPLTPQSPNFAVSQGSSTRLQNSCTAQIAPSRALPGVPMSDGVAAETDTGINEAKPSTAVVSETPRVRPPVPKTPSRSPTCSRQPSNASSANIRTSVEQSSEEVADGSKTRSAESTEPFSIGPWVGKVLDNRPVPGLPICLMFAFLLLLAYLRVGVVTLTLSIGSCWYLWSTAERTNDEISGKGNRWKKRVQGPVHGDNREETAEWINHALYALFPLISTDLLTPFIDLVEDALLDQVPPIVTSVRLVSPSLGSQPLQLTSLRPLSDAEWFASLSEQPPEPTESRGPSTSNSRRNSIHDAREKEASKRRRRDRILRNVGGRRGQGAGHGNNDKGKRQATPALKEEDGDTKTDDADKEEDPDAGQYVNYSIKFMYDASTLRREGWGIHMLAYFGVGVKGVGNGEMPVHIDMLTITGTINMRLLLSPSPPFVRIGTFSFPSLPDFDIAARPLKKLGWGSINVMEMPLLKSYVMKSVSKVAGAFVRPSSYTMDLDRLLLGKEASLRTSAIGVLQIQLHGATDLPKADTVGSCDPYVTVSLTKFNKPTFSTRTIINSRNPLWAETAFVIITAEAIEAGEKLQLRICDSDRFSTDDALGVVELDLADLIEQAERANGATKLEDRHDPLQPTRSGLKTAGYLDWSVRFSPLWKMSPGEIEESRPQIHDDIRSMPGDEDVWWMKALKNLLPDTPAWEQEREKQRKETLAWFTGERERDGIEAQNKPRLDLRSGVLQFHVHQCMDLEVEHLGGSYSSTKRNGDSAAGGRPALEEVVDVSSWESETPPSAYCEIILNDKVVYRTRTKQLTPAPYFNAVGERFLRDWTKARLVVVIRDERDREHDPILGLVVLDLVDVLSSSSQITRTFPIVGGIGWGHLRLSLLFKTVDISLPLDVSGYEIASLDVKSLVASDLTSLCNGKNVSIVLETEADSYTLSPPDDAGSARPSTDGTMTGSSSKHSMPPVEDLPELEWDIDRRIRLAVEYRQSCSLVIRFIVRTGLKKKTVALAMVRLDDCPDAEPCMRTAPIYFTNDMNSVAAATYAIKHGSSRTDLEPVGEVSLEILLRPGISRAHKKLTRRNKRFKHVYEAWQAAVEVGVRIRMTDQDRADDAMEKSEGQSESSDDEDDSNSISRSRSFGSSKSRRESDRDSLVEPEDDKSAFTKWRDHSKALHRQQKGVFQLKIVRTSKFVKDKMQEKLLNAKLTVGGDLDKRRPRGNDMEIEKEGQSTL